MFSTKKFQGTSESFVLENIKNLGTSCSVAPIHTGTKDILQPSIIRPKLRWTGHQIISLPEKERKKERKSNRQSNENFKLDEKGTNLVNRKP